MKNTMRAMMIAGIFLALAFMLSVPNICADSETNATVTKEMAVQAINESERIISEMKGGNFSTAHAEDNLLEARRVLKQAEYADILRNESLSYDEKKEAMDALSLIDWRNLSYADVLQYTDSVKNIEEKALLISDMIFVAESKAQALSPETLKILDDAKTAFSEERYNDAEKILDDFEKAAEKEKAENSSMSAMAKGAQRFLRKYWIHTIVVLAVLAVLGCFILKKIRKKRLAEKIRKMKAEEQALNGLMKKTQTERFKKNEISGLVYGIRMKRYQKRLQEIKEELPVLESGLTGFKSKQGLNKQKRKNGH
ncbi:MAG: hypothetical protein WC475_04415 [Candidatus Paceibacterota bacterium]